MDEEKLIAAVDRLWPVTAPRWLEAPTCEGWWWCRCDGEVDSVYFIGVKKDGRKFVCAGHDMPFEQFLPCRWFGPLVPPS